MARWPPQGCREWVVDAARLDVIWEPLRDLITSLWREGEAPTVGAGTPDPIDLAEAAQRIGSVFGDRVTLNIQLPASFEMTLAKPLSALSLVYLDASGQVLGEGSISRAVAEVNRRVLGILTGSLADTEE